MNTRTIDGAEVIDSGDGEFTALAVSGDKFAFSFAEAEHVAVMLAKKGLNADIDGIAAKKEKYYNENTLECGYSRLHIKCLSVIKTQLYSPEGRMKCLW